MKLYLFLEKTTIHMVRISHPHPKITIYDDVFSFEDQNKIFTCCTEANYMLGWRDSDSVTEDYFHHTIPAIFWQDPSEDQRVFFDMVTKTEPFVEFKDRALMRTVINCDTIADSHTLHYHEGMDVILYYANLKWEDGWSGETIFYEGDNIICALPYTPNRMVVFDGNLLHRFNGPSRTATKYRFSISTFFWKKMKKKV